MELAGYLVNAVVLEHRPIAEVARAHGASRSWLYQLSPGTERWARQPSCLARDGPSLRPPGFRRPWSTRSWGCASRWPNRASTPVPTQSSTTCTYATGSERPWSRLRLRSGGC